MNNYEVRSIATNLKTDKRTITGYAIVFNSLSEDLGGFVERILPEAVTRTLHSGADVWALASHDWTKPVARRSAGTLRLQADSTGVLATIDVAETTAGHDLLESVRRGDISGMSFRFKAGETRDRFTRENGKIVRTVTDMLFTEISPTAAPAYQDTTAAVRSLQDFYRTQGVPVDVYERQLRIKRHN